MRLRQLSANPSDPQNVKEAATLLVDAQAKKIEIDPMEVRKIGSTFLEATQTNPKNWTPALRFLTYCSFLNASAAPAVPDATLVPYDVEFSFIARPGVKPGGIGFLSSRDSVPINEAAKIERIGSRKQGGFPESKIGPRYLIMVVEGEHADVSHFEIALDNMLLRNAIIRNARFSYQGGPLILTNVYFVDCFFDVERVEQGQKFAKTLLASVATNFQAEVATKSQPSALFVFHSNPSTHI